jgi:hypothetical protein
MRRPSATQLLLSGVLAASLAGCASVGNYASDAPPGGGLEGVWRLNAAESDDPKKVLEKLRREARKRAQYVAPVEQQVPQQGGGRRRGGGQAGDGQQQPQTITADDGYQGDPNGPRQVDVRSPFVRVMGSDLLRNEVMAIHETPGSFTLDYGSSIRRLTPGERSVVSVPGGVADQSTGWKGKAYVVELHSQVGPDITEQYSLSEKRGRQLIVKVHLGGSGMPNVSLTRVYDPGGNATPRSLPTID